MAKKKSQRKPQMPRSDKGAGLVNRGRPRMAERTAIAALPEAAPKSSPAPRRRFVLPKVKKEAPARPRERAPGYLRLSVRIVDGKLEVIEAREVEGEHRGLSGAGAFIWEVVAAGRTLATGSVPDLGVRRGFARPAQRGGPHQILPEPEPKFVVRIPGPPPARTLERAELRMYAVTGRGGGGELKTVRRPSWPEVDLALIATLSGILPREEASQRDLRKSAKARL